MIDEGYFVANRLGVVAVETRVKVIVLILLSAFPLLLSATSPIPFPFQFYDFSPLLHTEITEFSATDQGYRVTFKGGLVKDNPNTIESDDLHWVILPAGITAQGDSTGDATVTLEPAASFLVVSLTAGVDVQARVQLLDDQNGLLSETMFADGEDIILHWDHTTGEPFVSKILVIIDGGTTETGLSKFMYADPDYFEGKDSAGNSSSGSFEPILLLILILSRLLINHHRQYKSL